MYTVLIVDDSALNRFQTRTFAEDIGYVVLEAPNGHEALDVIARQHVDLVLCDVNMPKMSGIELVREIRRCGHRTPIFMLTSEASPKLMREGKEAGATAWMVKPFKPEVLRKAMDSVTGKSNV